MLDDIFDFLLDILLELPLWERFDGWLKQNVESKLLRWTILSLFFIAVIALLGGIFYGVVYLINH